MTPERSTAYGRVMRTLEDMGPAKLHDSERERIRTAADTLLFCADNDPALLAALADSEALARHLTSTDRWTAERAAALAEDIASCGPAFTVMPLVEEVV